MSNLPRTEHPRPDFARECWMTLNGEWDFSIANDRFDQKIIVPFACECTLSGIGDTGFHPVVWYRRQFKIPSEMHGKHILLHFGAVDYSCSVWVNGVLVKEHTGGQSSFAADITHAIRWDEENLLVVRVQDDPQNLEQPRGKQFWEEKSRSIFYTRTTGIWQSVWLEAVSPAHLVNVRITPLFDEKAVCFDYKLSENSGLALETYISFQGTPVTTLTVHPQSAAGSFTVNVDRPTADIWNFYEDLAWSPEHPRLFDVRFRVLCKGQCTDEVHSYFGMRKVAVENGRFLLNGRPYYQKLVLDQGYWPQSLLTAPDDEAFVKDIQLVKEMGFNGVRLHQKVEDPRFYYHADRMGLLVWGEIGSAYIYSPEYAKNFYQEWVDCVLRDYNHPCIVVWVPLNESWGVQEIWKDPMQQAHSMAAYHITKSLDRTRPVVDNDGWEHTCGDLLTIHDYEGNASVLLERYAEMERILKYRPGGKDLFAYGYGYVERPVIVSEYGGVRFAQEGTDGWGYSSDNDPHNYVQHVASLTAALLRSPHVQGYCYTQLCDVESEQNGLLTYERKPKVDLKLIREANDGNWAVNETD